MTLLMVLGAIAVGLGGLLVLLVALALLCPPVFALGAVALWSAVARVFRRAG